MPHVQRKGIGKFLMQLVELVGYRMKMQKVALTVFNNNSAALEFYKQLRYEQNVVDMFCCVCLLVDQ